MPELAVIAEQLLAPVPGGTGRYTREMLHALARTAPEGWSLTSVVSATGDPSPAHLDGVDGPRVLRMPRKALVMCWERGIPLWPGGDSVHAMTPLAPPPRPGRGLIVTVHDTVPWTHPETLTARGVAWHRRVIDRAARTASEIVVPTEAVATDLARHTALTVPTRVIGEGVSQALTGEVDNRLELPSRYVLAIGTIEPRKGYADLVRAVAGTELTLVIIGAPGWGSVELERVAEESGLPRERLRMLGAVDDTVLAEALRRATVLAEPSMAEGFGLPVIEAMAAGVPVVHSDAPALVEVAGGAGISVPRGDIPALTEALRQAPHRRRELVAAGKLRVRRFTWETAARAVWCAHRRVRADTE